MIDVDMSAGMMLKRRRAAASRHVAEMQTVMSWKDESWLWDFSDPKSGK